MPDSDPPSHTPVPVLREGGIGYGFIGKLQGLKCEYRSDIRDRAAMEAKFCEKFEALNRVRLTDSEFNRLLDEIVSSDVFTASKTLLKENEDIHKCVFAVDRNDLDRQTRDESNRFQEGCVEENTNTAALVLRLLSEDYADKVIVTTIQKLGLAKIA